MSYKKHNEKLIAIYKKFLEVRYREKGPGELANYKWYKLPNTLPIVLMAYSQMLSEHSQELSNSINKLYHYIVNLSSWEKVISIIDEDFKYELLFEHIDPFATLALNSIYAIRSKFIFSVAQLCHQANMIKCRGYWKDDLPNDEKICFEHANIVGKHWKEYKKLKLCIKKVGNKRFNETTKYFRNKYNHRYSPEIEFGHTEFIRRKIEEGGVSYRIGYTEPLSLALLIPVLTKQYQLILYVYDQYKKLIYEQIKTIENGCIQLQVQQRWQG